MSRREPYPVVDVFAGPGGLGEGFGSLQGERGEAIFSDVVAIERDEFSHRTLFLRHFLRSFPNGELPDEYYSYLKGDIVIEELYRTYKPEFTEAGRSALRISLGPESHAGVRRIINNRLADRKRWVLVGGPPCQAYSLPGLLGRARHELRSEYRSITFGSYVIFFRYADGDVPRDIMEIIHVVYGARDMEAFFHSTYGDG